MITQDEQNCTNLILEELPRDKVVRRKRWEPCPQNQWQDLEYAECYCNICSRMFALAGFDTDVLIVSTNMMSSRVWGMTLTMREKICNSWSNRARTQIVDSSSISGELVHSFIPKSTKSSEGTTLVPLETIMMNRSELKWIEGSIIILWY